MSPLSPGIITVVNFDIGSLEIISQNILTYKCFDIPNTILDKRFKQVCHGIANSEKSKVY